MNSNATTAQLLEQNLQEYCGSSIAQLREWATLLGVDITIQDDGIWISRPGLNKALKPNMPASPLEWRMWMLQDHVRIIADVLWEKSDSKQQGKQ